MRVFLIYVNDNIKTYYPYTLDIQEQTDHKSVLKSWNPVPYYDYKPKYKVAVFFRSDATPFSIEPSAEFLIPYFQKYGELLPIYVQSIGNRYMVNVTKEVDCYNFNDSIYNILVYQNPNDWFDSKHELLTSSIAIKTYSKQINRVDGGDWNSILCSSKITSPIFYCMDRDHILGPFCTDGFFSPEEEFYHLYHSNNLKGLNFREVQLT